MKYNFDKKIDRYNSDSSKWNEMYNKFISNDLLPFWVADMDFETCPEITKAMQEKIDENIFGYAATNKGYFDSACNWTKRRHGYDIKLDSLIHSPGVVYSLSSAIRLFIEKDDKIMVSAPVYPQFYDCIVKNNREVVINNLVIKDNNYSIDFEDFENKVSDPKLKWYILCNPHNPVGRVWTREELNKIGDICIKHNVRVISDEIWRDLVFKEYKFTPFASLSKKIEDITITCFSASKTFNIAGLQTSFISLPRKDEFNKFKEELDILHIARSNSFNAIAVEAAFNRGEEWLSELLDYLEGNLNYLEEFIKNNIPEIKFIRPQGTYVAWLDFNKFKIDDISLFMQQNAKVALNDGKSFSKDYKGFLRMNLACPRYQLEDGLNRMSMALQSI